MIDRPVIPGNKGYSSIFHLFVFLLFSIFSNQYQKERLVSSKDISSINLILYIIQTSIVAVGDDGMALCLEGFEIVLNSAAEKGASLF